MKYIIFISILLYGCGDKNYTTEPDGLWYRHEGGTEINFSEIVIAYDRAQECTGLTAIGPYVKTVASLPGTIHGKYDVDKKTVVLFIPSEETMVHEFTHHLLLINTGDINFCHTSELFDKCSYAGINNC